MKTSIVACVVVCLSVVGCASHPSPVDVNNPSTVSKDEPSALGEPKASNDTKPCDKATNKDCKDNFDAVGEAAATGSRYVYDTGLKAWRYLTSDDLKKSVADTEARLKSYVDCAEKVEKALMDDATKKEEKK